MSINVLEILLHRPCYITYLYYIRLSYSPASAGISIINAAGPEGQLASKKKTYAYSNGDNYMFFACPSFNQHQKFE